MVSGAILLGLPATDFHSARGTESIILRSVRCALPLFLVAFTASSLVQLWPSRTTRWLLANRRYFGLGFAFGMSWHLTFVSYSMLAFGNRLNSTVLILDLIGVSFLVAMSITSFRWAARHLSSASWRRLHKVGAYVIWLLAVYIYQAFARGGEHVFDMAALGVLLLAGSVRAAAWMDAFLTRRRKVVGSPRSSAR